MSTARGWVQGYNAQAIVNPRQIVLACEVSQDANDTQLYQPMADMLERTLTAAGITAAIDLVLADAGYWSENNATSPGPDRLIATMKDHKQRRAARELGQTTGPPPPNATPAEEMEHLLRTPQGAAAYAQRSGLIEPIFGDHKHNRGIRSFRRRGLSAVRSEWAFIHLAGNMLKLHQQFSLITMIPLAATVILGSFAGGKATSSTDRVVHASLGGVTVVLYGTTAYYALFAPKVSDAPTRGNIRLHKALAWVHGAGMILTPILGEMAYQQKSQGEKVHGIASAHGVVGITTLIAYGAAILTETLK